MRIQVTEEDIKNGIPKNCNCCPIALAIYRTTNKKCAVIGRSVSLIDELGDKLRISLPSKAIEFISLFDVGLEVEPIEFELELNTAF